MTGRRERVRFSGEIWGVGTGSGMRVVVGDWAESPFGAFADVMVEHADGHRQLLAPTDDVATFVSTVYTFDEVTVAPVDRFRSPIGIELRCGPLDVRLVIGGRHPLGRVLRVLPPRVATTPLWARIVAPVARVAMPGMRTWGRTDGGTEYYGARDRHDIAAGAVRWDGRDLGPIGPVEPPVRFGFTSTPKRPSVVSVVTTIDPAAGHGRE